MLSLRLLSNNSQQRMLSTRLLNNNSWLWPPNFLPSSLPPLFQVHRQQPHCSFFTQRFVCLFVCSYSHVPKLTLIFPGAFWRDYKQFGSKGGAMGIFGFLILWRAIQEERSLLLIRPIIAFRCLIEMASSY